jgi:hypothetical protein
MVPPAYKAVDHGVTKEKILSANFSSGKSPRLPPLNLPMGPTI